MANATEQRQARAERALGDPLWFGEVYVRPYTEGWDEKLPDFAAEMLAFALSHRRGVLRLPPEFLKTTLVSQVLPLWLTYRYSWAQKVLRGMLLSEEEGMSQANLSVVSWHIENNEDLASDFRDARGRLLVYPDPEENTWREDAIVVARPGASKDPTWQAKGLDSSGIHGRRLDWLLGDDVVTPKNAFSPARRRDAMRLWDMQITTRLVKSGRAIMATNYNHEHDLGSTLARRRSYEVFHRPAYADPDDPSKPRELHMDGKLLWPENWSLDRLREEAEEKPETFSTIYLLDSSNQRGSKLHLDWLHAITPDETPLDECSFILSLDPAPGGEQADLDFFNVTVLACHTRVDLVASIDVRMPAGDQPQFVGGVHDRFNRLGNGVVWIGGAKVAMDRYLRGAITAVRPDLTDKIAEVSAPGDKTTRLTALGPLAKAAYFRVWDEVLDDLTSDPADRHQELSFREQWKEFSHGRHDDKLDGLDIALRTYREYGIARDLEVELAPA